MSSSNEVNSFIHSFVHDGVNFDYSSIFHENVVTSEMKITKNGIEPVIINFTIDVEANRWEVFQAESVKSKATILKSKNVPLSHLKKIDSILLEYIPQVLYELKESKNPLVLSSLTYFRSIISTTIRSVESNQPCECKTNPEFLIGISNFTCQQDLIFSAQELLATLEEYAEAFPEDIDSKTQNLMYFLNTSNETDVSFEDYYNFYVSESEFDQFILHFQTNPTTTEGCSGWCPLGCGSSHGCCGNYSGCCLYWHPSCYIHDKMCGKCKPGWFCLPGCKPDNPSLSFTP